MAKVKYTSQLSAGDTLESTFSGAMTFNKHSTKLTTYTETGSGDTIVFSGKGFTYENGEFTGGTITKVTFDNAWGKPYAVMTDLHLNAAQLPDIKPAGVHQALIDALFKGQDVIHASNAGNLLTGGKGADSLIGGDGDDSFQNMLGNDRITGGKGSDEFFFRGHGEGNFVVTDFDVKGAEHDQIITDADYTLKQTGHDVLLKFVDDGGTVRLLGVDVDNARDFILFV